MKKAFHTLLALCLISSSVHAADFDWTGEIDRSATESEAAFMKQISSRFQISANDYEVIAVIVDKPSDIFLVLRLAELSEKPITELLTLYQWHKKSGWGVIAKQIGIEPGSDRFRQIGRPMALKTNSNRSNYDSAANSRDNNPSASSNKSNQENNSKGNNNKNKKQ